MGKLVDETGAWIEPPEANSTPDPTPYLEGARELMTDLYLDYANGFEFSQGVFDERLSTIASYVASVVEPLKAELAATINQGSIWKRERDLMRREKEAAEEEVARLREALEEIASGGLGQFGYRPDDRARAALSPKETEDESSTQGRS